MSGRLVLAACAIGAVLCGSCKSATDSGPHATHVIVTPPQLALVQNASAALAVTVTDANDHLISNASISFSSSNPQIASVTSLGVVTSAGPAGTANVTVSSGTASTVVPVTVAGIPTSISVTPNPVAMVQKATVQLQAQVLDVLSSPIPGAAITFATGNSSLVTVSSTGLVTSVGPAGTTTITASSGALNRTVNVTVTSVAADFSLLPVNGTVAVNGQLKMFGSVIDAVGAPFTTGTITWSSSSPGVAAVSSSGVVTAGAAAGTVSITAQSGTFTKTVSLNIVVPSHPSGTDITTVSVDVPWGVSISSTGVVIAPQLTGITNRATLPSTTFSPISGGGGDNVAINGASSKAYLSDDQAARIEVLDLTAGKFLSPIAMPGQSPTAVMLSPDEQTLYSVSATGVLTFVDLTSTTGVYSSAIIGGALNAIAAHPTKALIYVTSVDGGKVSEVSTSSKALIRSFVVGGTAQESGVTPDGTTLWVVQEGGSLFSFDLASGSQSGTYAGLGGFGMAITPDGKQIWITNGTKLLKIFDTTFHTSTTITLAGLARRIAFSRDGLTGVVTMEDGHIAIIR